VPGQQDRAAHVHEPRTVAEHLDAAQQRADPAGRGAVRPHARGEAVGRQRRGREPVGGEQQQGARVGAGVPRAHALRRGPVAHHHRVQPRAEEALDERRRVGVGGQEVGEWAQHRAVAEPVALFEQPRRRRRQADAVAFERLEPVDLP
jgi:hypothetical protein